VTVAKSPIAGESTKETVKPLRGECRVIPVYSLLLVCVLTNTSAHEARVKRHPAFPAPSDWRVEEIPQKLGRIVAARFIGMSRGVRRFRSLAGHGDFLLNSPALIVIGFA